jgi:hypothetical protein
MVCKHEFEGNFAMSVKQTNKKTAFFQDPEIVTSRPTKIQ